MSDKRQEAQNVPAAAVREKSQALARAFGPPADADVIERAQPELVNGEAPAADGTGDFTKRVIGHRRAGADAEDADPVGARGPDQADRFVRSPRVGHGQFAGERRAERSDGILRRAVSA